MKNQIGFFNMYMNIYNKYGKDSKELTTFKKYYYMYQNKHHILVRIYENIMNGTSSL